MLAGQRTRGQRGLDRGEDRAGFGHAAGAMFAAGHVAGVRPGDRNAIRDQGGQVALRGGMAPHVHIHRRRDQDRLVRRHQQGRGQIIGMTTAHPGHQIGGAGRDNNQIGGAAELDMAHLGFGSQVEKILVHRGAGKGRDRQRRDEFGPGAGQDRHDAGPLAAQQADQLERFVGGDAPADNQKDALVGQHAFPRIAQLRCIGGGGGWQHVDWRARGAPARPPACARASARGAGVVSGWRAGHEYFWER